MITNLKLLEKDKKFLESSLYSEAQTFYIKLTDLYDKFIKVEPKVENNKKINLKKIDKNINTLIEAYLDALKEAKTSGKNVQVLIKKKLLINLKKYMIIIKIYKS